MRRLAIAIVVLLGCPNPRAPVTGDTGTESSSTSAATTTSASTTAVDDSTSSSTLATSEDGDECPFVCAPDIPEEIDECDIFAQDCPSGEKCIFYWDGGYDHTHCVPVAEDPAAIGEPCTVEGVGLGSADDCEAGAMCFGVDARTQVGTCAPLCAGTHASPICDEAGYQCAVTGGSFSICMRSCDPVAPECADGEACRAENSGFACYPDAVREAGAFGDPCEYPDSPFECDPGLFCARAESLPDCAASGCCNAFCDLEAPDPDAMCPGVAQGQTCVPWYEPGQAPEELAHVGACTVMP